MGNTNITDLLSSGTAFADLSRWRKIAVSGVDALTWLDDLLPGDIAELAPGQARHSVLQSATGADLARFTVAVAAAQVLLVQDPAQGRSLSGLLAPRVGSADVVLDDRTEDLALFAFPGRAVAPNAPGAAFCAPSCLGAGVDVFALMEERSYLASLFGHAFTPAGEDDVRAWRATEGRRSPAADAGGADRPGI
ncbi:MAG: hypothetical protein ABR529_14320 [Actinomycetota bacterium]